MLILHRPAQNGSARHSASADCRHIHFPGLSITPTMLDILDGLVGRVDHVSMDCQMTLETLQSPLVCEILSQLAIFMPNETEAHCGLDRAPIH
jgi:hypothetical protein